METMIINAGGFKYLGEYFRSEGINDLPDNVLLNKVLTGCGGTTIALENNVPYVICVPFKALIINKMKWAAENNVNVCAVMGGNEGSTDKEIEEFTGIKYMVTYDSLGRMKNILGDKISEYKILIDESHKLIDSACFRGNAIRMVLDNYKNYKSHVFMTATPVKDEHQFPELKDIQKCEIKWDNITPVNITYVQLNKSDSISKNISVIALRHMQNTIDGNAHIFINSVSLITRVIKMLKRANIASIDDIAIVCANTEFNLAKVKRELGAKYHISPVGTVKKLNFYTSTAFEGADVMDETGRTYVVSDGKKDHAKINILTTLPQIIARVRNSIYKYNVTLMYTPNLYFSNLTADEFEKTVKDQLADTQISINDYNATASTMTKRAIFNDCYYNSYVNVDGKELILNTNVWYNEMHNFDTLHRTYYVRNGENNDGTLTHNYTEYKYIASSDDYKADVIEKINLGDKPDFTKLCIKYCELANIKFSTEKASIIEEFPIIAEAYNTLGAEKMKALKYRRKDIEDSMIIEDVYSKNCYKIVKLLELRVGQWIASNDIKSSLQTIYSMIGIDKIAKASDIAEWYTTKDLVKRVNGQLSRGIVITTCKINIK